MVFRRIGKGPLIKGGYLLPREKGGLRGQKRGHNLGLKGPFVTLFFGEEMALLGRTPQFGGKWASNIWGHNGGLVFVQQDGSLGITLERELGNISSGLKREHFCGNQKEGGSLSFVGRRFLYCSVVLSRVITIEGDRHT